MSVDIGLLQGSLSLGGLTNEELKRLATVCEEVTVERGVAIFEQEDTAIDMYLILTGQVVLEKLIRTATHPEDRRTVVRPMGPGQLIGWTALTSRVYTVTGRVSQASRLIRIDAVKLRRIMDKSPRLGYKFMSMVADRASDAMRALEEALMAERALVVTEVQRRATL